LPNAQKVSVAAVPGLAVVAEEEAVVVAAALTDAVVAVVLAGSVAVADPDAAALAGAGLARDADDALETAEELVAGAALGVAALVDVAWLAVAGLAAPVELVADMVAAPPQAASREPAAPVAARTPSVRSMRRLVAG